MKLFILRHGDAGDRADARYPNDAVRPLSPKGIKRTRQLVNWLRLSGTEFDMIFTSPLTRARQTAELVARGLDLERKLRVTHHLSPEAGFVDLLAQLEALRPPVKSVLLVGHEPFLSSLISLLCAGGPGLQLEIKKGGLCRLEAESLKAGRCATLVWLLAPRHFGPKRASASR